MKKTITREEFIKIKKDLVTPTPVSILTGSMAPFINPGDTVWIRPYSKEALNPFDPIIFWEKDKFICHLYYKKDVYKGKVVLFAKGLNTKKVDGPFPEDDILGIVIKPKLPKWKKILMKYIF